MLSLRPRPGAGLRAAPRREGHRPPREAGAAPSDRPVLCRVLCADAPVWTRGPAAYRLRLALSQSSSSARTLRAVVAVVVVVGLSGQRPASRRGG